MLQFESNIKRENNEIIEKVAAGLRRMTLQPMAFVFIENGEWTWDDDEICGITVYHTGYCVQFRPHGDEDCPFIPIFSDDSSVDGGYQIHQFARGYSEGV